MGASQHQENKRFHAISSQKLPVTHYKVLVVITASYFAFAKASSVSHLSISSTQQGIPSAQPQQAAAGKSTTKLFTPKPNPLSLRSPSVYPPTCLQRIAAPLRYSGSSHPQPNHTLASRVHKTPTKIHCQYSHSLHRHRTQSIQRMVAQTGHPSNNPAPPRSSEPAILSQYTPRKAPSSFLCSYNATASASQSRIQTLNIRLTVTQPSHPSTSRPRFQISFHHLTTTLREEREERVREKGASSWGNESADQCW
ncbi:hypothetical protein Droror1_Dr00010120 [Drosera rotundifolia]